MLSPTKSGAGGSSLPLPFTSTSGLAAERAAAITVYLSCLDCSLVRFAHKRMTMVAVRRELVARKQSTSGLKASHDCCILLIECL